MNTRQALAAFAGGFTLILGGCAQDAETPEPVTLSPGTELTVTLQQPLTTRIQQPGDRFDATLAVPVSLEGRVVIPAGTRVLGSVARSLPANDPQGPMLMLSITRFVDPSGQEQQLRTVPLRIDPMAAAEPQDTMTPGAGEVQHGSVMPAPDEEIDLPLGHELRVEIAQPTEIAVLAGGDYREGEL